MDWKQTTASEWTAVESGVLFTIRTRSDGYSLTREAPGERLHETGVHKSVEEAQKAADRWVVSGDS
ncbi:hypothetical protein [Cellulosimicrobium cellulans]|nr:hypothetical protein [Cellulosimicrobium cellulans]